MFSQGELFVLIISGFFAGPLWIKFARQCVTRPFRTPFVTRLLLLGSLALAGALLGYVLLEWSSHDVRSNNFYIVFYFIMGVTWLGLGQKLLDCLNLRARDDVLERGNLASGWACGGAVIGLTACYAGGNVGDGPGWWVVIYSAVLSTGAAALAWIILDVTTGLTDTISIERDVAAGLRAGGFWIGAGLILGRAVAGNWVALEATNRDFLAYAWPMLPLLAVALAVELGTRPRAVLARAPLAVRGVLPGAIYVGAGLAFLIHFGAP